MQPGPIIVKAKPKPLNHYTMRVEETRVYWLQVKAESVQSVLDLEEEWLLAAISGNDPDDVQIVAASAEKWDPVETFIPNIVIE